MVRYQGPHSDLLAIRKSTGKIIGEDIYSLMNDFSEAGEVELNPYVYGEEE